MTYGEAARLKWGTFYCYYLKGWHNANNAKELAGYSDYAIAAYHAGREDRSAVVRQNFDMLTERVKLCS